MDNLNFRKSDVVLDSATKLEPTFADDVNKINANVNSRPRPPNLPIAFSSGVNKMKMQSFDPNGDRKSKTTSNRFSKKAQVTIFIILGIILVAGVILFFVFRGSLFTEKIPANIEPAYNSFLFCLQENTEIGAGILESQGGYIDLPKFDPGSPYMPFSSQLEFAGASVPYWYYVSGNNIQKEQVPSKKQMQDALAKYIEDNIRECNLDSYYSQGFQIFEETPKAKVTIDDGEISVSMDMDMQINFEDESYSINNHRTKINSGLGKLYSSAKKIYEKEQDDLFLENYAVDTIRLYTPVDGVELQCSPLVWNAENVFHGLEDAIEVNTLALKEKGGDFTLSKEENKYFVTDLGVDEEVRFINSKNWPHNFEVSPTQGATMISTPVGNQGGLGILGFCYVPYHYVYDAAYPVLIQVSNGDEIFQFPVAVVVKGNLPREALDSSAASLGLPEICEHSNTLTEVDVLDSELNPVDAEISYECLGTSCYIGKAEGGILNEKFPQCINGYITTRAEGYEDARYIYSTNIEGSASVILNKLYPVDVDLKLDNMNYNGEAIVSFIRDESTTSIIYPEQKEVELSEGQYEIQVYIYKNSSLRLGETSQEYCVDTPQTGLGGAFGFTEEKCFTTTTPSQIISNALHGGGKQDYYIVETELKNAEKIEIKVTSLPTPTTIEKLQENYVLFEDKSLTINFK